jgi:hypothetical protein
VLLHERMAGYQDWLVGLLSVYNPGNLSEDDKTVIRGEIHDYAKGTAGDASVRPLVELLETTMLQAFEDWCKRTARLDYQTFLHTTGWQRTRAKVLERCKHTCEGCGERRATQVHHLNYDDPRGEEMLFNLVGLCAECHEKLSRQT